MKRIIFLVVFGLSCLTMMYGQGGDPCDPNNIPSSLYILDHDPSGISISGSIDSLESSSRDLVELLPCQLWSEFKVIDFGFYIHHQVYPNGFPDAFMRKKDWADQQSPFYLLIGKQNDETGLHTKYWVDIKLPLDFNNCSTAENIENIRTKIEIFANADEEDSRERLFSLLEKTKKELNKLYQCCDAGTGERSLTSCGPPPTLEEYVTELTDARWGLKRYIELTEIDNINLEYGSEIVAPSGIEYRGQKSTLSFSLKSDLGGRIYNLTTELSELSQLLGDGAAEIKQTFIDLERLSDHEFIPSANNNSNVESTKLYYEDLLILKEGNNVRVLTRLGGNQPNSFAINDLSEGNKRVILPAIVVREVVKRLCMAGASIAVNLFFETAIEWWISEDCTFGEAFGLVWADTNLWEILIWGLEGAVSDFFAKNGVRAVASSVVSGVLLYIADPGPAGFSTEGLLTALKTSAFASLVTIIGGKYLLKVFDGIADKLAYKYGWGISYAKSKFSPEELLLVMRAFKSKVRSGLKAWKVAFNRPLLRKDVPFLTKLSEILEPSVLNKLPNGQADLDAIVAAIKHPCCGTTHPFMKNVADHLDDIKHVLNNLDGVPGFDKVVTALKNPNFFAQDGASHLLTKLKSLDPSTVRKLEGKIVDADNLDGICTNCLFDIEVEVSPGVFKKLELKSYSESTIGNIANSSQFKNQFKAYLADASNISSFDYIFNAQKTTNQTLVKQNFKTLFSNNNYEIFDQIGDVNNALMQSLNITSKSDFIDAVNDLSDDLYSFIKIE